MVFREKLWKRPFRHTQVCDIASLLQEYFVNFDWTVSLHYLRLINNIYIYICIYIYVEKCRVAVNCINSLYFLATYNWYFDIDIDIGRDKDVYCDINIDIDMYVKIFSYITLRNTYIANDVQFRTAPHLFTLNPINRPSRRYYRSRRDREVLWRYWCGSGRWYHADDYLDVGVYRAATDYAGSVRGRFPKEEVHIVEYRMNIEEHEVDGERYRSSSENW